MTASPRLVDQAYEGILQLVGDGEILDGDNITFSKLSDLLGMSRMPVTVALDRLQRDGIVESVPRMGTRLCRVDAETIWGLSRCRVALECEIASEAARWMTDEERQRLIEAGIRTDGVFNRPSTKMGKFIAALKCRDMGEDGTSALQVAKSMTPDDLPTEADREFHFLLAELCHTEKLRHEMERAASILSVKLAICEAVTAATSHAIPPECPPDHETLAQVIAKGDPRKASECMREHIEEAFFMYGFFQWHLQSKGKREGPVAELADVSNATVTL